MIGRMDENAQDPHKAAIPVATPEPLAQSTAEKTDPESEPATRWDS